MVVFRAPAVAIEVVELCVVESDLCFVAVVLAPDWRMAVVGPTMWRDDRFL